MCADLVFLDSPQKRKNHSPGFPAFPTFRRSRLSSKHQIFNGLSIENGSRRVQEIYRIFILGSGRPDEVRIPRQIRDHIDGG